MRKVSREMPAEWVLEVMRKAPYIAVSFIRRTVPPTVFRFRCRCRWHRRRTGGYGISTG